MGWWQWPLAKGQASGLLFFSRGFALSQFDYVHVVSLAWELTAIVVRAKALATFCYQKFVTLCFGPMYTRKYIGLCRFSRSSSTTSNCEAMLLLTQRRSNGEQILWAISSIILFKRL